MFTDALAGVNVAALGLIAATAIVLGRNAFTSAEPVVIAVASLLALLRWPLMTPLLVVAGAATGALWL